MQSQTSNFHSILKIGCHTFPRTSTWVAACLLSIIWVAIWILTFFLVTWTMDVETPALLFIITFWVGVSAESIIRYVESTKTIAILAKPSDPNPQSDNYGYRISRVGAIIGAQAIFVVVYMFLVKQMPDIFAINPDLKFTGQNGDAGSKVFVSMLSNWWTIVWEPTFTWPLMGGALFRVLIYKRNPKSFMMTQGGV